MSRQISNLSSMSQTSMSFAEQRP